MVAESRCGKFYDLGAGLDTDQAVHRVAAQGGVVQPARRSEHGSDPLSEGVSDADGEVVPAEHIVKGVEVSRGRYVIVDPDELAPFVSLSTKSIEVEEFVDLAE